MAYSHPRRRNPGRRRSRRYGRRSRNPGFGGLSLAAPAQLIPYRIPLPGILGTVSNGIVQGVAIGAAAFAGYVGSGYVVDLIWSKEKALASATDATFAGKFKAVWLRPVLFASLAGVMGSVVAMLAPRGNKMGWALAASAGPGIRAAAGIIAAVTGPGAINTVASGIADYLQMGAVYEAGTSDYEEEGSPAEGVEDYLQMGEMYEAGTSGAEDEEEVAAY